MVTGGLAADAGPTPALKGRQHAGSSMAANPAHTVIVGRDVPIYLCSTDLDVGEAGRKDRALQASGVKKNNNLYFFSLSPQSDGRRHMA